MTAVEWLVEQLAKNGIIHISDINKAKEMEKEQIIKDYSIGYGNGQVNSNRTANQYYNETYGKE